MTVTKTVRHVGDDVDPCRGKAPVQERVSLFRCLQEDLARHESLLDALLSPGFMAVTHYRISNWLCRHRLDPLARVVQGLGLLWTGADLSRRAEIGPGLAIYHAQAILVGHGSRLGAHCVLHQGCAILPETWRSHDKSPFPVLKDRVRVGAGGKVLGAVVVHHDARIAPNSLVLRDVPENATAMGVPARVVDARFRPADR